MTTATTAATTSINYSCHLTMTSVGPTALALVRPAGLHPQTTDAAWNLPRNVAPTIPNQIPHRSEGQLLMPIEMVVMGGLIVMVGKRW